MGTRRVSGTSAWPFAAPSSEDPRNRASSSTSSGPSAQGVGASRDRGSPRIVDKAQIFPSIPVKIPSAQRPFDETNAARRRRKIIWKSLSESQFSGLYAVRNPSVLPGGWLHFAHPTLRGAASNSARPRIGVCAGSAGCRIGVCASAYRIRRGIRPAAVDNGDGMRGPGRIELCVTGPGRRGPYATLRGSASNPAGSSSGSSLGSTSGSTSGNHLGRPRGEAWIAGTNRIGPGPRRPNRGMAGSGRHPVHGGGRVRATRAEGR